MLYKLLHPKRRINSKITPLKKIIQHQNDFENGLLFEMRKKRKHGGCLETIFWPTLQMESLKNLTAVELLLLTNL